MHPFSFLHHRFFTSAFLGAVVLAAFTLWLPAAHFPIVSDSAFYAFLGESLWMKGEYSVLGELHSKYLPTHPFFSYPLVSLFGVSLGMKLSTLLAGVGVLIAAYYLARKKFSKEVAVALTLAILFHHGFVVMMQLGSADLLLTLFVLLALIAYLSAERDLRWYLPCGFALGLACLTRYNPAPLFIFLPLHAFFARRSHLRCVWFWGGFLLGGVLFASWFLRLYLVFGTLGNDYTTEMAAKSRGLFPQLWTNIMYYVHPMRNILPVFLGFSIYGIFRSWRTQGFLLGAMLSLLAVFTVWPVLNIRYAFPAYVLLLAFACFGVADAARRMKNARSLFFAFVITAILLSDAFALCVYSFGACNAWFDRTVGILPKDLGLATEGFYTWNQARSFINGHAEQGAAVNVQGKYNVAVMREGVFRSDIRVVGDVLSCPTYVITQEPAVNIGEVRFVTDDEPKTYVVAQGCS